MKVKVNYFQVEIFVKLKIWEFTDLASHCIQSNFHQRQGNKLEIYLTNRKACQDMSRNVVYHMALVLCKSSPVGPEVKVFDWSKGVNFTPASLPGLESASSPTDASQSISKLNVKSFFFH